MPTKRLSAGGKRRYVLSLALTRVLSLTFLTTYTTCHRFSPPSPTSPPSPALPSLAPPSHHHRSRLPLPHTHVRAGTTSMVRKPRNDSAGVSVSPVCIPFWMLLCRVTGELREGRMMYGRDKKLRQPPRAKFTCTNSICGGLGMCGTKSYNIWHFRSSAL